MCVCVCLCVYSLLRFNLFLCQIKQTKPKCTHRSLFIFSLFIYDFKHSYTHQHAHKNLWIHFQKNPKSWIVCDFSNSVWLRSNRIKSVQLWNSFETRKFFVMNRPLITSYFVCVCVCSLWDEIEIYTWNTIFIQKHGSTIDRQQFRIRGKNLSILSCSALCQTKRMSIFYFHIICYFNFRTRQTIQLNAFNIPLAH